MFTKDNWKYIYTDWWKLLLLILAVVAVMAAVFIISRVIDKKNGRTIKYTTKELAYAAICLAASFALSFIPIYSLPSGGTITPASALPVMIFCYFFGFRKGLVVCFSYMLLQLLQKPYIVSPWSALFDYVLPYMALSLTGLFSYKKPAMTATATTSENDTLSQAKPNYIKSHLRFFIGAALYFVVRYSSHVLAGVLYWAQGIDFLMWSGDLMGWVAIGYSMTYNALFFVPDTLIALVVGFFVLRSGVFNKFMAKSLSSQRQTENKFNEKAELLKTEKALTQAENE